MSKKVVLKLEIHDHKDKQKALKAVSSLSGIESIAMDMKDKKLTIVGEVDPIQIVSKLRKLWTTQILTVGPAKEPDKKKEEEEKKKKKEEEEKKKKEEEEKKKEEERKRKETEQIAELWKNYRNLNPAAATAAAYYHQYHPNNNNTQQYYVHSAEENPNSCVVS